MAVRAELITPGQARDRAHLHIGDRLPRLAAELRFQRVAFTAQGLVAIGQGQAGSPGLVIAVNAGFGNTERIADIDPAQLAQIEAHGRGQAEIPVAAFGRSPRGQQVDAGRAPDVVDIKNAIGRIGRKIEGTEPVAGPAMRRPPPGRERPAGCKIGIGVGQAGCRAEIHVLADTGLAAQNDTAQFEADIGIRARAFQARFGMDVIGKEDPVLGLGTEAAAAGGTPDHVLCQRDHGRHACRLARRGAVGAVQGRQPPLRRQTVPRLGHVQIVQEKIAVLGIEIGRAQRARRLVITGRIDVIEAQRRCVGVDMGHEVRILHRHDIHARGQIGSGDCVEQGLVRGIDQGGDLGLR